MTFVEEVEGEFDLVLCDRGQKFVEWIDGFDDHTREGLIAVMEVTFAAGVEDMGGPRYRCRPDVQRYGAASRRFRESGALKAMAAEQRRKKSK